MLSFLGDENDRVMISDFNHLKKDLDVHQRVKLNSCLLDSYSLKELNSNGFQISNKQKLYASRPEAIDNLRNEQSVLRGGRPTHLEEDRKLVEDYLLSVSTESNKIRRKSIG